ncbi:hypothetical protein FQN60_007234 [Etheostoma spectabile]|uniref:Uncharacterized protein n=1 Tax=Etheostoma spectabile TaxID=54343 RepID=A0A5J5CB85_9PERO|nr:hypothetical protein FQN60_007234 [Etheostoma spectabile]
MDAESLRVEDSLVQMHLSCWRTPSMSARRRMVR